MEAFLHHRHILFLFSFFCCNYHIGFWFSGDSKGGVRLGMFFLSNGGGIMSKFSLGVDLWWIWGFEQFFVYD